MATNIIQVSEMPNTKFQSLQDAVWCLCECFEPKGIEEYEAMRKIVNFFQMDSRDINLVSLNDTALCEMMLKYECSSLIREHDERIEARETFNGWF